MNDLIDILQRAVPDIGMADQEFYRKHFRPLHDLGEIEGAQQHFSDLHEIRANVMPYREWLRTRPEGTKRRDYGAYVGNVQNLLTELRERFGIELLSMRPTLVEQRQRPH